MCVGKRPLLARPSTTATPASNAGRHRARGAHVELRILIPDETRPLRQTLQDGLALGGPHGHGRGQANEGGPVSGGEGAGHDGSNPEDFVVTRRVQ